MQISIASHSICFAPHAVFPCLQVKAVALCSFHPTCRQSARFLLLKEASWGFCEKYPRKQPDSPQGTESMGSGAVAMVVIIGTHWQ